jgi:hypothetical protein
MLGLNSAEPQLNTASAPSSSASDPVNGTSASPTPHSSAPHRVSCSAPKRRVSHPVAPPWMAAEMSPMKP